MRPRFGWTIRSLLVLLGLLSLRGAEDYWKEFWLLRLLQDPRQWELLG
jgi:hypothetical protein